MKYEGGTPDPPLKPKNVRAWCDEARAKEAGVPYVEAGDSILMKSEMANHGMDLLLDKEEKMELAEALSALEDASLDFCGKRIPKLDKRAQQKIVRDYQNELHASLNSNQTLTSTIAIAVPLVYAKKKECMLNLPGKLLSFAVQQLEEVVEKEALEALNGLHKQTVAFIQKSSRKDADPEEVSKLESDLGTSSSSVTDLVSQMCTGEA